MRVAEEDNTHEKSSRAPLARKCSTGRKSGVRATADKDTLVKLVDGLMDSKNISRGKKSCIEGE